MRARRSAGRLVVLAVALCSSSPILGQEAAIPDGTPVLGYGILARLPGLWNGPVASTTPAGSFERWFVDFRPVSASQISAYSTLDADTRNCMSFFIVRHGGQYKVALRTEGVFQEKGCVTYEAAQTAREAEGYYRFADFQAGETRAYTELTFRGDTLVMEVYTSRFGTVSPPQIHTRWTARLADRQIASDAVARFGYPRKAVVCDFSTVFGPMPESIFFDTSRDPYPASAQPQVGTVTVSISLADEIRTAAKTEILLLLTTRSLFQGIRYVSEYEKYSSRSVYLRADAARYTFLGMHPGVYYLYAFCDLNGDRVHARGDFMSSDPSNAFTLPPAGHATVQTVVDFPLP